MKTPGSGRAIWIRKPVPYAEAVALQERLLSRRMAGEIPDTLLLLQHPPVITLGRRGRDHHLLRSTEALSRMGVELHTASRGGDVTLHNPGQLVLYPLMHVGSLPRGSHGYLERLEETAIRAAGAASLPAFRRTGMSGAWTDQGKFAAIGFQLKRWYSLHGMAVNIENDLIGFAWIHGCGLVGEPVTSWKQVLGDACPSFHDALRMHLNAFQEVFETAFPLHPVTDVAELETME